MRGVLAALLYLSAVNASVIHDEYSVPESQHVGCYSDEFALSNDYGYYVNPITWEVCVRLCLEKDSRYAGIESRKHTCYCGNFLAENSEKADPNDCDYECYGDISKRCGGQKYMSLYQLKNTTSIAFLATTDNGVAYFKNKALSSSIASLPVISSIKADYHYTRNEIYFVANKRVYKSMYVPVMRQYFPPQIILELAHEASSLAVDWVNRKLYWSGSLNRSHYSIKWSGLEGSGQRELYQAKVVSDICIDPYEQRLFHISDGKIFQYRIDTKQKNHDMLFSYRFEVVTQLAVDVHKKIVYAVGYYESSLSANRYLVSTDYDRRWFRALIMRPQLKDCFSLNALNGRIFWGQKHQNERALYSFKVPREDDEYKAPKKIATLTEDIGNLKIYHEHAQTQGKTFFCEKKKCSHECQYSLKRSAECACPQNMALKEDKKTCSALPPFWDKPQPTEAEISLSRIKNNNNDDFPQPVKRPRPGKRPRVIADGTGRRVNGIQLCANGLGEKIPCGTINSGTNFGVVADKNSPPL